MDVILSEIACVIGDLLPVASRTTSLSFVSKNMTEIISRTTKKEMSLHAANECSIELLKWSVERGSIIDENISNVAAKRGCIKIIKWLKDNNYPFSENVCNLLLLVEIFQLFYG